ncbi:hypothetical protein AAEO56_11620 [Flavobacterium sp. DGU11]|uniref:Uncharacterized protein n=1 Tax=Flavobacterium arundinis TaxID=3139143 RepID=A0ABU9HYR4_9FLAO
MKKKINIVLIVAVLGLWGTLGYRYINNYFHDEENISYMKSGNIPLKDIIAKRDTFTMVLLGRDPFLGHITVSREAEGRVHTHQIKGPKPAKVKPNTEWPDVKYFGFIKSGTNGELALLKIDGQLFKLHKGEAKNDLVVQKIFKDSVLVIYNKEKRVFKH